MKSVLIIFMFLLVSNSVYAVENPQNYLSVKGGFLSLSDLAFDGTLEDAEIKSESGFNFSGALGTKFNPFDFTYGQLRSEIELSYGEVHMLHMKSSLYHEVFDDANLQYKTLMANLYYDHKIKSGKLTPYVGGGLGWVWAKENEGLIDDNVFAYQLMAGFAYEINSTLSLVTGAKYFRSAKLRMDDNLEQLPGSLRDANGNRVKVGGERQYRYRHTKIYNDRGVPPLPVTSHTNIEALSFEVGFQFAF